jgi:flagellar hook-basal body complex protein FliE
MSIGAINSYVAPSPLASQGISGGEVASTPSDSSFGSVVRNAVESLDRSQKGAETEIARAVAGESPDLHRTIVALQSADLSFQLALQVRNKLIGAYDEIMRMQV